MKVKFINKSLGLLTALLIIFASCTRVDHDEAGHTQYTCPMHPTVLSERPATCPVCGMDLVRKSRPEQELKVTEDLRPLIQSPNHTVVSTVRTISPVYSTRPASVEATGIVTYDSRNIYTVPSRVAGRVERMHLKYEYQQVRKGQLIAEIYSPELTNAQKELVFLLMNDKDNSDLISAAKQKLRLLGVSASEIDAIVSQRSAHDITSVYSPYVGMVIATKAYGNAVSNTSKGSEPMGTMDTSTKISSVSEAALVRDGDYVDAGQTLVRIVDASSLLIELDITGEQAAVLKVGDQIQLDLGNGVNREASVEFVQPYFNQGENFAKVRVYTESKDLRVGQLVRARLSLQQPETLWVPREAVVSLGAKDIVFVKERNVFKPRAVVTGVRSKGQIEVLGGLATSDKIASSASFMVDSDSFIKLQE